MDFLHAQSPAELQFYHQVVAHSGRVRSHLDMLHWLQGDMQQYLAHDIMVAAWGDFQQGHIHHDIISAVAHVRSLNSDNAHISPLLLKLVTRWHAQGKTPFTFSANDHDFLQELTGWECTLGQTSYKMHSALVHGISDKRASHDCLYIAFRSAANFGNNALSAMAALTPHIDTALRQVDLLPHQTTLNVALSVNIAPRFELSERELEILHWVTLGKTNPEIGSILDISEFTVKNHMKRIFKKMNVSNRAQAVGMVKTMSNLL
jgi:transcriptional regulator EpsA